MGTHVDGLETNLTRNKHLLAWVKESAALLKPDRVVWCDGTEAEKDL